MRGFHLTRSFVVTASTQGGPWIHVFIFYYNLYGIMSIGLCQFFYCEAI